MVNKGTKRRWIAVLTIMAILAMMLKFVMPSVVHAYAEETNVTVGDADSDGKITIVDAYYILLADSKRSVGMQVDADLSIYDVDFNGRLDIMDAYLTLLYNSYVSVGRKDVIWPPVNGSIMTTTQTTNTTEPITTNQTTTTSANTNNVTHYESGDVLQFSGISWNVRSGVGGYVIGTIETGEKVRIVSRAENQWYIIQIDNGIGYINIESPWLFKEVGYVQPELKKVVSFDLVEFGDILVFYDQIVEVKTSNGIRYLQYGDKVIVTGKETNESISVAIVDSTDEGTIDYNNNSGFFKTYK